jgi:hypothetical protein
MIDVFAEDVMKLADAAAICPGGAVSTVTMYRWTTRGLCGSKLETINVGGTAMTSKAALQRFFNDVTYAKEQEKERELDDLCDEENGVA